MRYLITLLAVLTLGCASSKSIPTSSDASVSADAVTAKGGTIACASGLHATLVDGEITGLDCASNAAWTDPPTAEETTALAAFGDKLLNVLSIPLTVLAAVARALAGVN